MIEVLQKQRQYFDSFQTFDVRLRIKNLKGLKAKILSKRDDVFDALKKDLNKHEFEALSCELGLVMNELNYLIKNLEYLAEDRVSSASVLNYPAKNFKVYEPYGVTLVVSPWNYPFQLTMIPVIGAIAGGNTVVVKPSRNTPNVTKVIKEILSIFPEEYVYVVTDAEKIDQLFDQKFDFVFYTGSANVGKELLKRQAEYITPMILELGGKCPCIVSKSANIKVAAKRIAFGKFLNAGQTCVAPDFLLVDAKIKDKFLEKLIKYVQEFYYKDGVLSDTFVRIINQKALDGIINRINPTKVVFGGNVNGLTMEPTILDNVTFEDEIMQEEIFGPVLPIIVYDDINEVVRRLRTMPKPLALYYFGKNQKEGAEILKRCPSGGGCINEVVMHVAETNLPFGGVGESGMGSYHGKNTFYAFVHEKSVLKKSTKFDMGKKYPPHDAAKLKFAKGLFGFGDKAVSKAVVPASVNENVEFVAESLAEEPQFEEQVETSEVQNVEEYIQESADQVVDTQDYVQDTEETVYDEMIVPDGELELEETGDAQEPEVIDETASEEVADENIKDTLEDANGEQTEREEVEETVEEAETVATETVEKPEIDNDEIADITEQTSTIDREPEDFEEDYVETQEEDGEITDVENDFSEEEEIIEAIDAELKELYENEEDDNDGDAEQADTLEEDTNPVENVEIPVVEESLETQPVDATEHDTSINYEDSQETNKAEEQEEVEEGYVPEFSEVANIALEQLAEEQEEVADTAEETEEAESAEDYEPQVEEEAVEETEESIDEVEPKEEESEIVEEIEPEEELDVEDEIDDDDEGDAEQADDLIATESDLEEDLEEYVEDETEEIEEDVVNEPDEIEEVDNIEEQPEEVAEDEIEDVEVVEDEVEVEEVKPEKTETTNEVFKMLEEIEKETEEPAEEVAEEVAEVVENAEPETTNEVFKMLEEIEKETQEETVEEPTKEDEVEPETVEEEVEPEVEEVEVEEVEPEVEEKKEVEEEKPKKTTTKKPAKTTTKKSTTGKSATKKSTAKSTKKKADDEKKKSTKKTPAPKKAKTEKAEPKEKKPTKRAVSKKVDAKNDAQRAQDEINAMLNSIMPSVEPIKVEEPEDDFLNSLNNLVSKNIDSNDEE